MSCFDKETKELEASIFSEEFVKLIKKHVEQFDQYVTKYSKILYGESFQIKHEIKITREGQQYYKFDPFSMSTSSGKKQGEALFFDLAYLDYAQYQNIYHLDFLLNDKKELIDVNQLIDIADILDNSNIQLVFSILQDKLPQSLNNSKYVVLRLAQNNKLFRIEEINSKYKEFYKQFSIYTQNQLLFNYNSSFKVYIEKSDKKRRHFFTINQVIVLLC